MYLQEPMENMLSVLVTQAKRIRQTPDKGEKGYLLRTQESVEREHRKMSPQRQLVHRKRRRTEETVGGQKQQKMGNTLNGRWGPTMNNTLKMLTIMHSAGNGNTKLIRAHTVQRTKYLISLSSSLICIFSPALVRLDCFFWGK